jgi:thermitase
MKLSELTAVAISLILILPASCSFIASGSEVVDCRLVVSISDSSSIPEIADIAEGHGFSVKILERSNLVILDRWTDDVRNEILSVRGVAAAEREVSAHIDYTPNDPYFSLDQWGVLEIQADKAWDYTTGNENNVTVAVLDTGVDYTHDDLTANMWKDANGYYGYDFWNDDNNPMDDNINGYQGSDWVPNMQIYHGTHVAGVVGAVMNNGLGIAGISQAKIMSVKVMNDSGEGTDITVSEGIRYAVDNGADIITMSLGVDTPTAALKSAVDYAVAHHVVLTAAAGNEGASRVSYPAGYPQVIAVGAITEAMTRASFSNYGSNMDLMAPGTHIYSTKPTDSYQFLDGTSTATPFVAGVAALMLSANPGLTPAEIRTNMNLTADDIGSTGWDVFTGWGVVNAYNAVKAVSGPSTAIMDPPSSATPNETLSIKWVVTGVGNLPINQTYIRWGYSSDNLNHLSDVTYNQTTPASFSANNVVAPNENNGSLYIQSVAIIDGTEHVSSIVQIKVSVGSADGFTNLINGIRNFIFNDIGLLNFILILAILITVILAAVAIRRSHRRSHIDYQPPPAQTLQPSATPMPINPYAPYPPLNPMAAPAVQAVYVDISSKSPSPAPIEITEGTRVIWRNADWAPPPGISIVSGFVDEAGPHPDGIFASGLMVSPGEYWSCVFNVQGTYSYFISNLNQNGKVIVKPKV